MRTRTIVMALAAGMALPAVVAAQDVFQGQGPLPGADGFGGGPEAMFERFDADGDGRVTQGEVDAFRAGMFAQMDGDGDGQLTPEEALTFASARMQARIEQRFGVLDADGSGTVSATEFAAGRSGMMFDRLDTNGDGVITRDEVPQRGQGPRR